MFNNYCPNIKVHLLCHSMGNRVFAYGIKDLYNATGEGRLKFESIVLAAADISVKKFLDCVDLMLAIVQPGKLIILCSPDDRALQLSSSAQKHRIGLCMKFTNGKKIIVMPSVIYEGVGVFIYNRSDFGGDSMFHSYFYELPEIIDHLRVTLGTQHPSLPVKFHLVNTAFTTCVPLSYLH